MGRRGGSLDLKTVGVLLLLVVLLVVVALVVVVQGHPTPPCSAQKQGHCCLNTGQSS